MFEVFIKKGVMNTNVCVRSLCGFIFLPIVFSLSACGGGGQPDSSASALATPETINGISVPPEPDATLNNATLAGVDSNSNGVRDDVERKLATLTTAGFSNTKAIAIASAYQEMVSGTMLESQADASALEEKLLCAIDSPGRLPKELYAESSSGTILDLTVNTDGRLFAIRKYRSVLGRVDPENVVCK